MNNVAKLKYVGPENKHDKIQLIVESQPGVASIIYLDRRENILNLLQQLRLSLFRQNSGSLMIQVNGFEYKLGYDAWRAMLYLLEHWFDRIIDEEWDSFQATLDDN